MRWRAPHAVRCTLKELRRATQASARHACEPGPLPGPSRASALPLRPPADLAWPLWISSSVSELAEKQLLRSQRAVTPVAGSSHRVHIVAQSVAQPGPGESRERRVGVSVAVGAKPGPHNWCESQPFVVFASNDYLGLSIHPRVREAAAAAAAAHGCGPRSSALVCGYTDAHERLESALAWLKHADECLLFPTGYAANTAVLGALASSPSCAIFSDALNHASIVDGARLAAKGGGAQLYIYRHNDLGHLGRLLASSSAPRKVIVSDSIFSMDGDAADVVGLADLRDAHGALLVLDEAHATLLYGERGGGIAEETGAAHRVDLHIGTLSKAFGAHGGFVACSSELKRLLVSRGRPGIYSTALPAPAVAAATAALEVSSPELRARLWQNVDAFNAAIGQSPRATLRSPIVPIVLGTADAVLQAAARLQSAGFLVPAIRPPTVPEGTARLRVALSAAHEPAEVQALVLALEQTGLLQQQRLLGEPLGWR